MSTDVDYADAIIERMAVPGDKNLFILGCLERPATVYMQQVRAMNLIYALDQKIPEKKKTVLVVGGGAGGLTAAAAAAALGWQATVLEKVDILQLAGSDAPKRWLHPYIYDWPAHGTEESKTCLGVMDWSAAPASDVVAQLRKEWRSLECAFDIDTHVGVSNVTLGRLSNEKWLVQWNGKGPRSRHVGPSVPSTWGASRRLQQCAVDVVILAVGFGLEAKSAEFPCVKSYWEADDIDNRKKGDNAPPTVLVSGTGDGGLIDALRFSYYEFRHDAVLQKLENEWLGETRYRTVKEELLSIEDDVGRLIKEGKLYEPDLNFQYQSLSDKLRNEGMRPAFREDVVAVLAGQGPYPLTKSAAPINRFLLSLTNVQYLQGTLTNVQRNGENWTVKFKDQALSREFADVVIRHGPIAQLRIEFPEIYQKVKAAWPKERHSERDPTRDRLFDSTFRETLAARANFAKASSERATGSTAQIPNINTAVADPLEEYRTLARARLTPGNPFPPDIIRNLITFAMKPSHSKDPSDSVSLLIAPAGYGKTALLMSLAIELLANSIKVPLLVSVRHFIVDEKTSVFLSAIETTVHTLTENDAQRAQLRSVLLHATMQGRIVLLLDGLDECESHIYSKIINSLREWADDFSRGNRIIATSRQIGGEVHGIPIIRLSVPGVSSMETSKRIRAEVSDIRANIRFLTKADISDMKFETIENAALQSLYQRDISITLASVADTFADLITGRNPLSLLLRRAGDRSGWEFSNALFRDLFAAAALTRVIQSRCNDVHQFAGLVFDEALAHTSALAIALAQTRTENDAFHLFENVPDTLDFHILKSLLGAAKYSDSLSPKIARELAKRTARIITVPELATIEVILNIADICKGLPDNLGLLLSTEVSAAANDQDAVVLHRVIRFLGNAQPSDAGEKLTPYLMHETDHIANAAAQALGELGQCEVIPVLMSAYLTPSKTKTLIFKGAVTAIVKIGGEAAEDALLKVASDTELYQNFRWPAIEALGTMSSKRALPLLISAAQDPSPTIRASIAKALGSYTSREACETLLNMSTDTDNDVRIRVFQALSQTAIASDMPILQKALNDSHISVRLAAAEGLERLDRDVLIELLKEVFRQPDDPWQSHAAEIFGHMLGDAAAPILTYLANLPNRHARLGAARGFAGMQTDIAVSVLAKLSKDTDEEVRAAAVDVIPLFDSEEVVDAIVYNLSSEEQNVATYNAVRRARSLRHPKIQDALRRVLLRPDFVGAMAANALGYIGEERDIPLMEHVWRSLMITSLAFEPKDSDYANAIGRIGGEQACKTLRRFLDDSNPDRRLSALRGLALTAHAASIPAILYALDDSEERVRYAATEVLQETDQQLLRTGLVAAFSAAPPSVQLRAANLAVPYTDEKIMSAFSSVDVTTWDEASLAKRQELEGIMQKVLDLKNAAQDSIRMVQLT